MFKNRLSLLILVIAFFAVTVEASIFTNRWDFHFDRAEILQYVLTAVGILIGLVLCTFGYRLFKPVLFVVGFIVGAGIVYLILWEYTESGILVLVLAPIGVGILCGILLIWFAIAGIFVLGGILGFLLFSLFMSSREGGLIHSRLLAYLIMAGVTLAGGILALIFQKTIIICATALAGAYAVVAGVDRYINGGFSQVIPHIIQDHHESIHADLKTYIEIGACVLLCVIGIVIQFKKTGKNYYHKHTHGERDYDPMD